MLRNRLDVQLRNVCLIFRLYGWLQSLWTPWTPFAPLPWNPWDRTGSQHDIQCSEPAAVARGQKRGTGVKSLQTAGLHSVPKSAVLPYASGVGGLSRRLLNRAALALLWGKRPCRRPRFIGPPFLPGRSWGRSASGDAFLQETPTTGEDFQCRRPPPRKAS